VSQRGNKNTKEGSERLNQRV